MNMSIKGLAELAGHEGVVLSPYRDSVGVWTYGIGHTAAAGAPDPAKMEKAVTTTLTQALQLFLRDVEKYEDGVNAAVKVKVAQHQFDALVSFHYNTGGIRRAKLTKLLNKGDIAGAAKAFDGWHKPPEVIARRNREKALFRDGTYHHRGMANTYTADARGRVQWGSEVRVDVEQSLRALLEAPQTPPLSPPEVEVDDEERGVRDWPTSTGDVRVPWWLVPVVGVLAALLVRFPQEVWRGVRTLFEWLGGKSMWKRVVAIALFLALGGGLIWMFVSIGGQ